MTNGVMKQLKVLEEEILNHLKALTINPSKQEEIAKTALEDPNFLKNLLSSFTFPVEEGSFTQIGDALEYYASLNKENTTEELEILTSTLTNGKSIATLKVNGKPLIQIHEPFSSSIVCKLNVKITSKVRTFIPADDVKLMNFRGIINGEEDWSIFFFESLEDFSDYFKRNICPIKLQMK